MATIVGVHGIWWDQATGPAVTTLWTDRLLAGLEENHCPDLDGVSVRVAYYGHLYNDGKGGALPPEDPDPQLDPFELELLEAMAADAGVRPPEQAVKFGTPSFVPTLLRGLARTPYFGAATSGAVLWLVRQVRRYFADEAFRADVHAEIEGALAEDTRVVVAHSLGSIAAYQVLREHPDWPPRALVTIGSPLGLPGVLKRLDQVPGWPGSTTTWTNVAAKEDPVAAVKHLRKVYDVRVDDRDARNTVPKGHDAAQYLRNLHTARAIIAALADARS